MTSKFLVAILCVSTYVILKKKCLELSYHRQQYKRENEIGAKIDAENIEIPTNSSGI